MLNSEIVFSRDKPEIQGSLSEKFPRTRESLFRTRTPFTGSQRASRLRPYNHSCMAREAHRTRPQRAQRGSKRTGRQSQQARQDRAGASLQKAWQGMRKQPDIYCQ